LTDRFLLRLPVTQEWHISRSNLPTEPPHMMKHSELLLLVFCLVAASASVNASASENVFREIKRDVKHAGKQVGKDAKTAGKQAGHAGKQVGKDIGKAAKNVGKSISRETRKLFND